MIYFFWITFTYFTNNEMNTMKFISVDFQNDFTSTWGLHFKPRKSVKFVEQILVPYFRKHHIKIAEIISDYRQPKPRSKRNTCCPGEWWYESWIPEDIKLKNIWIKCMNSPIWVRKNIGLANKKPWIPYQDTNDFDIWLEKVIWKPEDSQEIILFGLTVDCCVLCTAQELSWRGYTVKIIDEAVDCYSWNIEEKKQILNNYPLLNWANVISWKILKSRI